MVSRVRRLAGLAARAGVDAVRSRVQQAIGGEALDTRLRSVERVVQTLGEMKGVALKLGQTLAVGAGLPDHVRKAMLPMLNDAPPLPFEEIRAAVQEQLSEPFDRVFTEFSPEPFAAASLGQVHRGRLPSGDLVAIKVQYPDVAATVDQDLGSFRTAVRALGLGRDLFDSESYFEEIARELRLELDYCLEERRLRMFAELVKPWPKLVVPATYAQISTDKMLVMEYLEGDTVGTLHERFSSFAPDQKQTIGTRLLEAVYGPFLAYGLMQTDTHPGNFIVMSDGRLGLLDFGCVKAFPRDFWNAYRETFAAALQGDWSRIVEITARGGFSIELEPIATHDLLIAISEIVARPFVGPYDFGACRIQQDVRALAVERRSDMLRVRPPAEGILFYRAITGLLETLRMVGAQGDFRSVFEKMLTEPTDFHKGLS